MGEIKSSRSIPEHRQPRPPSPSAQSVEDSAREQRDRIERERKLADERSQNALKLQRKQRLQALIQKRKSNMAYLKVNEYQTNLRLKTMKVFLFVMI